MLVCVAKGLLYHIGWQPETSKYLYSIRLAPASSVECLGILQFSKVLAPLLLDTQIYALFFFLRTEEDRRGSIEMNVNISRTVEKMFYMFVKGLSLCCRNTHNIAIAGLFNCNSLLTALFRSLWIIS